MGARAMVRFLRNPVLIGLSVVTVIASAFQLAGVVSMPLVNIVLGGGVWVLLITEVWASEWIRKTGKYWPSVVLAASAVSGTLPVTIAATIYTMRTPVLELYFVNPQRPALRIRNTSPAVALSVTYNVIAFDLDSKNGSVVTQDGFNRRVFQIPITRIDHVNPSDIVGQDECLRQVPMGTRLFGCAFVRCQGCRTRAYWFLLTVGQGGRSSAAEYENALPIFETAEKTERHLVGQFEKVRTGFPRSTL